MTDERLIYWELIKEWFKRKKEEWCNAYTFPEAVMMP
jgi:hypothetical protein